MRHYRLFGDVGGLEQGSWVLFDELDDLLE